MTTTRRRFLALSAAAGASLGLPATGRSATEPLRILILGGTGFIGPHMVRSALTRGHEVTLFNRGRTNKNLFPELEQLVGDRDGQLDALAAGEWDAVIDNSGYVPRHVRDSAHLLRDRVGQYLFISSVSAYADFGRPDIDENDELGVLADPSVEEVTGATYGPLKALCEQAVAESFAERATIVRPGYIVGPGDSTDRWTYWPVRLAAAGRVLVPGTPADPVQFIDARDLAEFVMTLLQDGRGGAFNGVGPNQPLSMGAMLAAIQTATATEAELIWADAAFLAENNALFPIWSPPDGPTTGLHRISNKRSIGAGLRTRSVGATATDTLAWWDSQPATRRDAMRAGLRVPPSLPVGPAPLRRQMVEEQRLLQILAPDPTRPETDPLSD